jgi:hypothetical protein
VTKTRSHRGTNPLSGLWAAETIEDNRSTTVEEGRQRDQATRGCAARRILPAACAPTVGGAARACPCAAGQVLVVHFVSAHLALALVLDC